MREIVEWTRETPRQTAKYWGTRQKDPSSVYLWPDLVSGARRVCTNETWHDRNKHGEEVWTFFDTYARYLEE